MWSNATCFQGSEDRLVSRVDDSILFVYHQEVHIKISFYSISSPALEVLIHKFNKVLIELVTADPPTTIGRLERSQGQIICLILLTTHL